MQRLPQRSITELLDSYNGLAKVSKVRILGEEDERELKEVFVELSIVNQPASQHHTEILGMMDSAMRRRFNPFAHAASDTPPELPDGSEQKANRRVKPDELLRRGMKAIVTGAPGCGKTTLLKYLALRAQEKEKRLAAWFDLKLIDESLFARAVKAAEHAGSLILPELWLNHVQTQLALNPAELELLRAHWQERFKAGEVVVLLDGFDELQDETIERSLRSCIGAFTSILRDNTLVISTRPYAQHKLGGEGLREMEIEPLNQRQIKAFLNCYYPDDVSSKGLLKSLRERSPLRELLHVPLLLGVISRLHREGRFTDSRIQLYKTIVKDLADKLDPFKKVSRQFRIYDQKLRLDFLEFVAFERLLRAPSEEGMQASSRIVFSYDLLKEEARRFLEQEGESYSPRALTNDALATPLLREVGADTFAFTHLTLQEYLAAQVFVSFSERNKSEALRVFCRAYHDPTIAEMEVLPMALGALPSAETLYAELERWGESLTFANIRMRARGLAYSANIKQAQLSALVDRLFDFILGVNQDEEPYRDVIVNSFADTNFQAIRLIEAKALSSTNTGASDPLSVAAALARMGSVKAINSLISALKDKSSYGKSTAIEALARTGSGKAVDALISVMIDKHNDARWEAADALGQIGSEKAIEELISVMNDENSDVRWRAAAALVRIDSGEAAEVLVSALEHGDVRTRRSAAKALGLGGPEEVVGALISALNDEDAEVRWRAALALETIDPEEAVARLIPALHDEDSEVRWRSASVLGKLGSEKAVNALVAALNDENNDSRWSVATALGRIGSEEAVDALISALNDKDSRVRSRAADALGQIGSERAVDTLVSELNCEDKQARFNAACAVGRMGYEEAVDVLISVLNEEERPKDNFAQRYETFNAGQDAPQEPEPVSAEFIADVLKAAFNKDADFEHLDIRQRIPMAEDSYTRQDAAYVLGQLGSEKAVEALLSALADGDIGLLHTAADALGKIGSERAVGPLISTLNNYGSGAHAARALAQIKREALTRGLEQTISHSDAFARKKAVTVIVYYSDERRLLERLRQLAQTDEDRDVRDAAQKAAETFARKLDILGMPVYAGATPPLPDNVSKEGVLVHEVGLIVSAAGHFFREVTKYDEGIDGEIEFRDEYGRGTPQRVCLQLKSGDSYLERRKDGKEFFRIRKQRHALYWRGQAYPVLLVVRTSDGRIRWMDVREYLRRHGTHIRKIEFQGEPFTRESVEQMRFRFAQ
jgi:HEAT repeat protein/energy-coupling factor transporter ATP-binding protein EcfA2